MLNVIMLDYVNMLNVIMLGGVIMLSGVAPIYKQERQQIWKVTFVKTYSKVTIKVRS